MRQSPSQGQVQPTSGAPQAPGHAPGGAGGAPQAGGTSVNIAILDSKDFPSEVAPMNELFSELSMMDGQVLFECPGLMKATGIDLMNCPLNVHLQLRIRRRMQQGSHVLWHVVLPLPLISKHFTAPPYEWETWIGLLPNTQDLAAHPPDMMFTQAVHLISRPEFPKLRLRFTYHNPQLQAQALAQQEQQEQENRRRKEQTEQMGRAQFQDIHNLMRTVRESGGQQSASAAAAAAAAAGPVAPNAAPVVATPTLAGSAAGAAAAPDPLRDSHVAVVAVPVSDAPYPAAAPAPQAQPSAGAVHMPTAAQLPVAPVQAAALAPPQVPSADLGAAAAAGAAQREERLRDALAGALRFVSDVRAAMASQLARRPPPPGEPQPALPPMLDAMEVLAGSLPATALDTHCQQLRQCLQGCLVPSAGQQAQTRSPGAEVEPVVLEGLRAALAGTLDDAHAKEQLGAVPRLREPLCEVSALARERANLVEQQRRGQEQCRYLQDQCAKLSQERDLAKSKEEQREGESQTKKHFEKLLNQQRQALQMNFDTETQTLKSQLEEMKRRAQESDGEVTQLRAQLGDFLRSRGQKA